jgi:hypothetical protein
MSQRTLLRNLSVWLSRVGVGLRICLLTSSQLMLWVLFWVHAWRPWIGHVDLSGINSPVLSLLLLLGTKSYHLSFHSSPPPSPMTPFPFIWHTAARESSVLDYDILFLPVTSSAPFSNPWFPTHWPFVAGKDHAFSCPRVSAHTVLSGWSLLPVLLQMVFGQLYEV